MNALKTFNTTTSVGAERTNVAATDREKNHNSARKHLILICTVFEF